MKVLSILGWDIFNTEEVKTEYSVGGKSVDYSLIVAGTNKVFLEVKKPMEDLEKHQEQLLDYSFRQGVRLAVLTNGVTWWFYFPVAEGRWEQRRILTIDILQQETSEVASSLIGFLSKDSIATGKAIENAETIYNNRTKQIIIRNTLPQAWSKVLFESNELVNLVSDMTEKLCGYKPDREVVKEFLSENMGQLSISTEPVKARIIDSETMPSPHEEIMRSKLTEGKLTPLPSFRSPILEALVEFGGKGETERVLEYVETKMKPVLKPTDYETVSSGGEANWRNRARWERKNMVAEGLLHASSPRGLWEITEKGREYLKRVR